MARSKSSSSLTFIPIALVVVAASAVAGYYLGGGTHSAFFTPQARQAQPAPVPTAASSNTPDHTVRVAKANNDKADYTSPDAPDIQITEVKQPKLNDESKSKIIGTPPTNATSPDPEASQQGTVPADQTGNPPSPNTTSDTTTPDNSTDQTGPDQTATSNTGTDTTKGDYEKITTPTDPEASQQGTPTASAPKPVRFTYRVQTGTFAVARNARILADALRGRGYDTSLRTETQGDQTLYRVQTGAYQSKSAANAAADALRASGYPAYVSPISQD